MDGNLKVWMDGKLMDYSDCKVPILTHSLQYGSGIFEGIRSYKGDDGVFIFRLDDHVRRFLNSMKIYSINTSFSFDQIKSAIINVVRANNLDGSYIRPFAFYNDDSIGLTTKNKKVSIFIAALPFGKYFTNPDGIKCKVSSWERIDSSILPVQAKASGNYANSIIASNEAESLGYDEAIITSKGKVAEGPGENIFMIKDGDIITPPISDNILIGITRDSIGKLSKDLDLNLIERSIARDELYTADELFFAGTAAEITPIVKVDNVIIRDGKVGEVTSKLSKYYHEVATGKVPKYKDWLVKVD